MIFTTLHMNLTTLAMYPAKVRQIQTGGALHTFSFPFWSTPSGFSQHRAFYVSAILSVLLKDRYLRMRTYSFAACTQLRMAKKINRFLLSLCLFFEQISLFLCENPVSWVRSRARSALSQSLARRVKIIPILQYFLLGSNRFAGTFFRCTNAHNFLKPTLWRWIEF